MLQSLTTTGSWLFRACIALAFGVTQAFGWNDVTSRAHVSRNREQQATAPRRYGCVAPSPTQLLGCFVPYSLSPSSQTELPLTSSLLVP